MVWKGALPLVRTALTVLPLITHDPVCVRPAAVSRVSVALEIVAPATTSARLAAFTLTVKVSAGYLLITGVVVAMRYVVSTDVKSIAVHSVES